MRPLTAHNKSQGFTLIEQLIIILIVGILASLAGPGLQGMYNRTQVNSAAAKLQGFLQEAQRQAMRTSQNCTVTLPPTGSSSPTTDPGTSRPTITSTCFVTGRGELSDVKIRYANASYGTITFNFKGWLTAGGSDTQAIVLFSANDPSNTEKCIIISTPLGLLRSGTYLDSQRTRTTVDATNSSTDPNCKIQ